MKFGEAKGYRFLTQRGFRSVSFVARANTETPDLQAFTVDGLQVVCEVKTINPSNGEADRRNWGGVISVAASLASRFFRKLDNTLNKASSQITAYHRDPAVVRIAFIIIKFDDILHEYEDRYREQIEQHMRDRPNDGLEVVFYWMPSFEVARS